MTVRAIFKWQNADSTLDLNNRLNRLISNGLVWSSTPASVSPGIGLHIVIDPFVAVSQEGLTVVSDAVETFPVLAGASPQPNVVVVYIKYNPFGVPASPIEQLQVLDWATYNAHPDKAYMNVLAEVTLAPAAVIVNPGDISFVNRDEVTPVGRSQFRGTCLFAGLPLPASPTNRVGDFYWVSDVKVFYFWTGLVWEPINTGSYKLETTVLNNNFIKSQRDRNLEGSGVLSGQRPGIGDYASQTEINLIETPSVADSIDLDGFSALINGHYVETHARSIALPAKPVVGTRYDLVFLEVYRVDEADPEAFMYDRNPNGALQYDLNQLDQQEENVAYIPTPTLGNNYNVNELGLQSHIYKSLRYRFATAQGVPDIALYWPSDVGVLGMCINVDGAVFGPAGAGSDQRIGMAVSATSVDGVSWMLPLLVIKRTNVENFAVNDAVKIFRSGIRYVFPVYAVTDQAHNAREALDTLHRLEPSMQDAPTVKASFELQSGFKTGLDYEIQKGVAANSITFFDTGCEIRIKGYEDYFTLPSNEIVLNAPPGGGYERYVIYLEMTMTLYNDDATVKPYSMLSPSHRPYFPSRAAGLLHGQGWKRGYVNYEVKAISLGAFDATDEDEAMTKAGWFKGDPSAPSGHKYDDGGIWYQGISLTYDDRVHPYLTKWAIPIVLSHRRNSALYNWNANPNGTGATRSDDRTVATEIHPDDLVDLRHQVDLDSTDLQALLDQNLDLVMKGQLRTKFSNKLLGSGSGGTVAGTRILQADSIGPVVGAYQLQAGDSLRRIWSDAREFHVVSTSFDPYSGVPISNPLIDYTYNSGLSTGYLTIKTPPGSHLVRHIPAVAYAIGDSASADYLDFYGPPCWTTRAYLTSPDFSEFPSPVRSFYYNPTTDVHVPLQYYVQASTSDATPGEPFRVFTKDLLGRATSTRGSFYVDLASSGSFYAVPVGAVVKLSWWVHYDRTFVASADGYQLNYGLAEIPDTVHKVTKDPLGAATQLNVGAIYVTVQKTLAAALSVTFTDADVTAASGLPGVVTLYGLDTSSISFSSPLPAVSSIKLNWTQTTITFNFGAAYTGTVSVTILFKTTARDQWVEIGRGGKSVQAIFSWSDTGQLDTYAYNGGVGPSPTTYTIDMGNETIWTVPEINGKRSTSFPQVWAKAAVGAGDWTLSTTGYYGFEYSNMLSLNPAERFMSRYIKVIAPLHKTLGGAAADNLLIEYTYTPYQGKSNRAGEAPITATALPLLKNMLHGTVEANTDFYATQSGAASFFSGVLTWSGYPVNGRNTLCSEGSVPLSLNRFEEYNFTELVKPAYRRGVYGMDPNQNGDKLFNAAAVLRLPFPEHTSMSLSTPYHKGVMPFDLDPARAGAGAGTLSYAPGYFGAPLNDFTKVRYDHFCNGLTPLGYRETSFNVVVTPDQFCLGNGAVVVAGTEGPHLQLDTPSLTLAWRIDNRTTSVMELYGSIKNPGHVLLKRAMLQMNLEKALGLGTVTNSSGLHLYFPEERGFKSVVPAAFAPLVPQTPAAYLLLNNTYDATWTSMLGFTLLTQENQILATCPGEIFYFYHSNSTPPTGIMRVRSTPDNTGELIVYDMAAMSDSQADCAQQRGMDGTIVSVGTYRSWVIVDTVRIPFSSTNRVSPFNFKTFGLSQFQYVSNANGALSLRGREIGYPDSWSPADTITLESTIKGATDLRGAGRGLFCGSTSTRTNMPVLVPGSGTGLDQLLQALRLQIDTSSGTPEMFPYQPGEPLFKEGNRVYLKHDHGGPIAYVFLGLLINPSSDEYKNNLVLQISGGPTGFMTLTSGTTTYPSANAYSAEELDGTALDAFWPKHRPLISRRG